MQINQFRLHYIAREMHIQWIFHTKAPHATLSRNYLVIIVCKALFKLYTWELSYAGIPLPIDIC